MLVLQRAEPEGFLRLEAPGRLIHFYELFPLYAEEMHLKLDRGVAALLDRLDEAAITDFFDPERPNAGR